MFLSFIQGGVPDINGTARSILRDWVSGRIPYYTSPPAAPAPGTLPANTSAIATLESVSDTDVNSSTLLTTFAPAFDLAALFGEADALAFGGLDPMSSKGVRMDGIEGESEDANVGWMGEEDEEEVEDEDEEMSDDGFNVDDLLEGDNDEDDEMDQDVPAPVVVAKKAAPSKKVAAAAKTNIVSVAPTGKKGVSFASKPLGPTGTQKAKLFAANDPEAPGE